MRVFEYWGVEHHTFLHHSQTLVGSITLLEVFEYHTFLHHSQTSNLKLENEMPS